MPETTEHDCGLCSGIHEVNPATLARGIPAECWCGWTPHDGFFLADHFADMKTT